MDYNNFEVLDSYRVEPVKKSGNQQHPEDEHPDSDVLIIPPQSSSQSCICQQCKMDPCCQLPPESCLSLTQHFLNLKNIHDTVPDNTLSVVLADKGF